MNDICNLLGDTPRSVKRFVNVYRLIKAVALPYSPNFVDEIPFADFKLVLFLLAIVTGMTSISQTFFLLLRRSQALPSTSAAGGNSQRSVQAQAIDLWGLLENLRHILRVNDQERLLGQDEDFVSSEAAADTSNQDKNTTTITNDKNNFLAYGDIEANRDFDRLQQWVKDYEGGLWKKLPLTSLADWIPQVARFSYRIEEV